jgi:hypothetical protein
MGRLINWKGFGRYGRGLKEVLSKNTSEGLRRTMKDHSQDSRCPSQDSNRAPTEYMSRVLPVDQTNLLKLWEMLAYFFIIMNEQCIHNRTAGWNMNTTIYFPLSISYEVWSHCKYLLCLWPEDSEACCEVEITFKVFLDPLKFTLWRTEEWLSWNNFLSELTLLG